MFVKVKETLSEMLNNMADKITDWVERKQCSHKFISLIASDLKHREEKARGKVHHTSISYEMMFKSMADSVFSEKT